MACIVQVYMTPTVDVADEATARGLANEAVTCFNANPLMTDPRRYRQGWPSKRRGSTTLKRRLPNCNPGLTTARSSSAP